MKTPYDTGARLEPRPWIETLLDGHGRVDFDNDEGATVFTLYAEPDASGDGVVIRIDVHQDGPIRIEVTGEDEDVSLIGGQEPRS